LLVCHNRLVGIVKVQKEQNNHLFVEIKN